ncbi:outer membrane beta-barrel protein [Rufibacter roseus]|uniref:Outer membrane beta-barrel protein n=1 Tax=Rufibacter roseus TaxID=1567108 RepID=A0ABW2DGJ5_9BACT|nr:outer membrane beta-barrel protein [Rufibacter roseus]
MKQFFRFAFLAAFFLMFHNAFAQKGEVKGVLMDAAHKEPLGYATIAVYTAQDTTLVTFRVSDEKGGFKVPNLALDRQLRLVITMTGFQVFRKEFTLTAEQPALDLGQINMEQADHLLQEVLITAEIPPIIVRQDTLEFNANSFKTLPTALVEDLLKKLPGVNVDASGNITVQGKPVNRILVDGKEFFGSDPKIASQNLPANVIDKVQVVNDPDALRRDPDMPVSEIPQVINLKLKKGIKQGAFGKMYAGGGTNDRFEAGGILNIFRDTTQLSVLGYANNLNRSGFGMDDIRRIGGFDRSGINSMMMMYDGGFAINGISFGGLGSGIQTSTGGGGNFNTLFKNGLKLNLQYFYGGVDSDLRQVVNTAQTVGSEDILASRRVNIQDNFDRGHRIGGRLDWKLDSLTDLSIRPGINFGRKGSRQFNEQSTLRNYENLINESDMNQHVASNNLSYSSTISFNRSFRKKGRSLSYYGDFEYSTFGQDQVTNALNQFFEPTPRTTLLNQLRDNDRQSFNMASTLSYNEPFSKTLSGVVRLNSRRFDDEDRLNTYDRAEEGEPYDQLVPELSNQLDRTGWRNYLNVGLKWKLKDLTVQPGIQFTKLDIKNQYKDLPTIPQNLFFVFPSMVVNWKGLNLSYNVHLREPDATDLQAVQDNTNPLIVQYGNPNLVPAESHSISMNYRKFDSKRSMNYWAYVSGSINNNAITRARTFDGNGVQTFRPVNTDGNWSFYGNGSVNKDYKYDGNRQFSLGLSGFMNYTKTLILLNNIRSYGQTFSITPRLESRMNLNDKFELSQSLSLGIRQSAYEDESFRDLNYHTRSSESGVVVRLPKKLVWEANLSYNYNSNTAPGLRKSYSRLNLGVTYVFLKDDRGQLKLFVYDALDQNLSAYRSIRENMIEDFQTTVLTRYAMLSFTYNIRNFGGKVGSTSNNSFFRF